jgi:hypothetical protein
VQLTADSSPPHGTPGILTGFVIGPAAIRFADQPVDARKQLVISDLVATSANRQGTQTNSPK